MLSSKQFLRRVRQLPATAKPEMGIDRVVDAYKEISESARKLGAQRITANGPAVMREHLKTIAADKDKAKAKSARKEVLRMYAAAERINKVGSIRESLAKKAREAADQSRKAGVKARTTGEAMRSVLTAWDDAGASLTERFRNLVDLQLADRAVESGSDKGRVVTRAEWGNFRTVVGGILGRKRLEVMRDRGELVPAYPRLLGGALHSSLQKEGK